MPKTVEDLVWWGFNIAMLGILWFIRRDIQGLREDVRQHYKVNNWLRHAVLLWHSRCSLLHPNNPMPPLGEDPGNGK